MVFSVLVRWQFVAVGLGFGSTVFVNVVDVVCPFCFCCVLGGGVVDTDLFLDRFWSQQEVLLPA